MGQAIPFLVLLCLQAAFLTVSADKKGPPINIGKQEGGDIRGGRQPGAGSSFFKVQQQQIWNVYKDDDGKFVIPYVFENMSSYNPEELFNFALAMDQIDRNTCIRFRPRRNEHDYIYIKNERNGCYSAGAGRGGGQQILGLQSDRFGRCTDVKTLIHEMIHAIGFVHEHNRYDRDNHVKIHLENVRAKYEPQFHKASFYQSHTYDVPYDYHSIMHYEKDSFAKRKGAITIETLDEKYQDVIGMQQLPSESDYKRICMLYNCGYCMGRKMKDMDDATPQQPQNQECVDTNPSMCQEMKEKEALGCNYRPHSDYCCQTCKPGGEEPSSPREEQTEPPSTQRPAPSPHCYDNSPTVCEFLVEENSLDCYSNVVRSLCCHTCEVHSD